MHPITRQRISSLIHTSADDARISMELMHTEHGADYTLKVASGAILRLEVLQAKKLSHRKVFATAARKALKALEKGPLT